MSHVLALDASGMPRKWITYEDAIVYQSKSAIAWSLGEDIVVFRGGIQKDGTQSILTAPSIIAIKGTGFKFAKADKVALTNKTLFSRDRHICGYCGTRHTSNALSRDHIKPVSKGGLDVWENVITACVKCNTGKGAKSLTEAGLKLLYVPYAPSFNEHLVLTNRNILADQMDYLATGIPKYSRVFQ